jgi:hypothetical protein
MLAGHGVRGARTLLRSPGMRNQKRLRHAAIAFSYRHYVAAHPASGQATAAPPMSLMNSRRLMPNMGTSSPVVWRRRALGLTPGLPHAHLPQPSRQVLGPNLNRSESRWGAADPLLCFRPKR